MGLFHTYLLDIILRGTAIYNLLLNRCFLTWQHWAGGGLRSGGESCFRPETFQSCLVWERLVPRVSARLALNLNFISSKYKKGCVNIEGRVVFSGNPEKGSPEPQLLWFINERFWKVQGPITKIISALSWMQQWSDLLQAMMQTFDLSKLPLSSVLRNLTFWFL